MVDFKAQDLDFRVSGLTSLPETTRASRNYLSLVVNGRYIKNFQLDEGGYCRLRLEVNGGTLSNGRHQH